MQICGIHNIIISTRRYPRQGDKHDSERNTSLLDDEMVNFGEPMVKADTDAANESKRGKAKERILGRSLVIQGLSTKC